MGSLCLFSTGARLSMTEIGVLLSVKTNRQHDNGYRAACCKWPVFF